jgi:hypothetical protein
MAYLATPRRWVGEAREQSASVVVAGLPPHQPLALEPVDQTRQTAARDEHPLGQLGHPQPPLRSLDKLHQHVVGRERKLVLGQQVGLEPAHQHGMGLEEVPPGDELSFGESPRTSHGEMVRRHRVALRTHPGCT